MGTRADFYVGTGENAEWLGSIAYDGYRIDEATEISAKPTDGKSDRRAADRAACWVIKSSTNEDEFRSAVALLLTLNEDATLPEQGWPWPWKDSNTTDYAYAFVDGHCKTYNFGEGTWPDMTDIQNVTLGKRSGMLILGI